MQVRPAAVKSLLLGCCLAWEMSCSVCLNFEHRQPYHCYFYEGIASAVSLLSAAQGSEDQRVSHVSPEAGGCCELVPDSLWWLRRCVTAALQESSLPPNLAEHTLSFYPR